MSEVGIWRAHQVVPHRSPWSLVAMTQPLFRWMHNEDAMATDKLAEGIRGRGTPHRHPHGHRVGEGGTQSRPHYTPTSGRGGGQSPIQQLVDNEPAAGPKTH